MVEGIYALQQFHSRWRLVLEHVVTYVLHFHKHVIKQEHVVRVERVGHAVDAEDVEVHLLFFNHIILKIEAAEDVDN